MSIEVSSNSGLKRSLLIILSSLIVAICLVAIVALNGIAGVPPTNIGIKSEQLADCPSSPNCVNSFSQDTVHRIEPISYDFTPAEAVANLKKVIESLDRTKIITTTDNYLYAESTSKLMGFVDDVEFYLDSKTPVIHVRSASRLGESDLGVNRQRIETIRAKFNELKNK